MATEAWLALAIGNSRLHWAWFDGATLCQSWHTPHLEQSAIAALIAEQFDFSAYPNAPALQQTGVDLWIASVVPEQTRLWQPYGKQITLNQIPLPGVYATLGIDRALAVWGAIERWGVPILVIDGGTALTITAADQSGLRGGAIVPGLHVQWRSLALATAALPMIDQSANGMPPRWGLTTIEAIHSGVFYCLLAGVQDFITAWQQENTLTPTIVFTGGDGAILFEGLQGRSVSAPLVFEPNLVFWGMQHIRKTAKA
jgi:type III pantothenate kinase